MDTRSGAKRTKSRLAAVAEKKEKNGKLLNDLQTERRLSGSDFTRRKKSDGLISDLELGEVFSESPVRNKRRGGPIHKGLLIRRHLLPPRVESFYILLLLPSDPPR